MEEGAPIELDMISRLHTAGGAKPPLCVFYGKPGIGKTTLAAQAPGPIFLQTEDGLTSPHLAHVPTFGLLKSYDDVMGGFGAIAENYQKYGWKTVVIDSVDRMAPLLNAYVCAQNDWKKLEDGAYGKGKTAMVDEWRQFMSCCLALRNEYGLGVILLGHHKANRIAPPDADPYTQYGLTLHEDVNRILVGDSDMVLFATHPLMIKGTDVGFGKKATRAIAEAPVLFTAESGAHVAKNRYGMPNRIPMQWDALASYVPAWAGTAQEAAATEAAE